ncbi:hypothetical protein [Enterococcus sp. AZ196]|uniref:hypothetical protein n=1 Tax=Enterococcus sp. AZ196 TaxID=2774659 RepID=UPI003D29CCB6
MDVMVERCCGLDVHQKTVVACTLVGSLSTNRAKKALKTFGTRTFELAELALWLKEQQITTVVMESSEGHVQEKTFQMLKFLRKILGQQG